MNAVIVNIPVLKASVTTFFGEAGKDFKIPKDMGYQFEGTYAGRAMFQRRPHTSLPFHVVIHVKERGRVGVLVHEIVHAVSYILDAMGMVADHNNDEIFAYTVQHLFEEIVHKMNK